jgi:SnoaL-like domain
MTRSTSWAIRRACVGPGSGTVTKDWKGFAAVFTADALFDISHDVPGCIVKGADNIAETARVPLIGSTTVHHGHCPEIEITSDTTAKGIWAMEDVIRWSEESDCALRALRGYGHYLETYERVGGDWLIKTLKLTRLKVDIDKRV